MSNDFDRVTKYLDITKVEQDTTVVTKPHNITKVRDIKKIQTVIVLPEFYYEYIDLPTYVTPRLLFQYNVTMTQDFRVTDFDGLIVRAGALCIKWRVGTNVFRYFLTGIKRPIDPLSTVYPITIPFEDYAGQLIKKNCVFEYWMIADHPQLDFWGILSDMRIGTSRYRNPNNADEVEVLLEANLPLDLDTLGVVVPETIPTVQPDIVWDDNP